LHTAGARLKFASVQSQIELLWEEYTHDPERQALACAALCLDQAPHLASWLKAKILGSMPDQAMYTVTRSAQLDGRIRAYSQLCESGSPPAPPAVRKVTVAPKPAADGRRAGRRKRPLSSFQANYKAIFGVVRGGRAERASELLQKNGHQGVQHGGIIEWKEKGYPVVQPQDGAAGKAAN
jgi:hypothetical protein